MLLAGPFVVAVFTGIAVVIVRVIIIVCTTWATQHDTLQ